MTLTRRPRLDRPIIFPSEIHHAPVVVPPVPEGPAPSGVRAASVAPRLEALEERCTPTTLVGLTTAGALVTFDSSTPGTIINSVSLTGLGTGESLVGIDDRPANGQLYGVSSASKLYSINLANG